uniref:Uncharacterized protein n=1 Tax=Lygus hesperus TaxID=30085 RepID=A0A0A9YB04_LYGHE
MTEPLMDDNEIKNNNCFWLNKDAKKTETIRSQNEVFLYDEAEPLAYGCSETSLPPKVTSFELSGRTEESKIPSEKLSVTSALCRNKSEYYSVQSLSKNMRKSKLLVEPESGRVSGTSNFQNAILSKYNEFSENSSKSLSQHETEYFKNSTDDCENCDSSTHSTEILSRRKSSKMREIFNRKLQNFVSSSDSEADQSLEIHSDEVFSTGASEIAEDVQRLRYKTVDRTKKANSGYNKKATERDEQEVRVNSKNSDIQWLTSKSIVKMVTPKTRRETRDTSPKRVYAPQRKLSVKRMNANAKPCNLFVEEIKRNNLVMREEIFSSSKSRNRVITDSHLEYGKMISEFEEEGFKKARTEQLVSHKAKNDCMEVFEAKGCSGSGWSPVKAPGIRDAKTGLHSQSGSFETANSHEQNQQVECTERKTSGYSEQVKESSIPAKADVPQQASTMKSIGTNTSESAHSQSVSANQNSNESGESTIIMAPSCGTSRYVKLPGLTEAFMRDDKCVQELRIKDGVSFESANILSSLNMAHDSSQSKVVFLEEKATDVIEGVPALEPEQKIAMEKKDQSTSFESPMEDRLTQTLDMLIVADTSVQCESHIIDSVNGNSNYRNDHQEIMICNDEGTGVQLYNILGHPLTDMEGYLLKDSHGRFLVRFDNFGVPTTCTDGKTIFLEDGTKWEHLKGYFNIIHQRFKKKLLRSLERNKMKSKIDYRAKRPIENAKRVSNKLERLTNISQYASTDGNSSQCFEVRHDQNPLRKLKFKNESANMYDNTTSTLVAEMKSIAKLRNALLEKINFIADRGPQRRRFPTKNETRSYKSMRKTDNSNGTNWKSEPRINSDRGRIQRNSNKWIRNVRRDMDEERLLKNKTIECRHSSRVSPLCLQDQDQVESAATSSVWRPEPLAALHVNSRWQPQPESSTTLTF